MTQQSPVLDRTVRELIEELAIHREPPIYELTPEEARVTLLRAQYQDVDTTDERLERDSGVRGTEPRHHRLRPLH
jgi:hypothetical protein